LVSVSAPVGGRCASQLTREVAHGFDERHDLPAPLYLFLIGAGAVVFVSFLLVLRRPVARQQPVGDDVPPVPRVPWGVRLTAHHPERLRRWNG